MKSPIMNILGVITFFILPSFAALLLIRSAAQIPFEALARCFALYVFFIITCGLGVGFVLLFNGGNPPDS